MYIVYTLQKYSTCTCCTFILCIHYRSIVHVHAHLYCVYITEVQYTCMYMLHMYIVYTLQKYSICTCNIVYTLQKYSTCTCCTFILCIHYRSTVHVHVHAAHLYCVYITEVQYMYMLHIYIVYTLQKYSTCTCCTFILCIHYRRTVHVHQIIIKEEQPNSKFVICYVNVYFVCFLLHNLHIKLWSCSTC